MQFSDAEVDAAARILDAEGRRAGWWSRNVPAYDDLDPVGKSEFGGLIEAILRAAANARVDAGHANNFGKPNIVTISIDLLTGTGARLNTKANTITLEADGTLKVIAEKQRRNVPAGIWRSFTVAKLEAADSP